MFFALAVFAQTKTKDTTQSCVAYWHKGEIKNYTIIHTKEKIDNGKSISKAVFNYDAVITVLDSTKEGYTLQWDYKGTSSKKNEETAEMALVLFKGLKIVYKTTATGEFKELMNWEEVRDFYISMMQQSIPKNLDDSTKMMLEKTKALFGTREAVEATLIKEVTLLHVPHGYQYSTKGAVTQTTLPSPFGTDPIPALLSVKVTEFAPKQDFFRLVVNQRVNKEAALKMMRGVFEKMNVASQKEIEEGLKMFTSFEVTDNSDYKISISTGWVSSLVHSRIVDTGSLRQAESYEITEAN